MQNLPEEACGLVAGMEQTSTYQAQAIFPLTNILHSEFRFLLDARQQLDAFQQIDNHGWSLIAIFHSHPNGPAVPSPTDIAEAFYPDTISLIWSKKDEQWICRGFLIQAGEVAEIAIDLIG